MVLAATVAQAAPVTKQEVKVPFSFMINGQEMPAGTYTVSTDDEQSSTLLIQGNHEGVYVLTAPINNGSVPQDTSLVFAKDGDHYRLTEVWNANGDGVDVVETR
jgi:hypothetical protein